MLAVDFRRLSTTFSAEHGKLERKMGVQVTASAPDYPPQVMAQVVSRMEQSFYDARAAEWLADTCWESSISRMTRHPRFRELVEMGEPALRRTLARMQNGDVQIQFFPLLKDIARQDPVPPEERGLVPAMAARWLEWGRQHGKI